MSQSDQFRSRFAPLAAATMAILWLLSNAPCAIAVDSTEAVCITCHGALPVPRLSEPVRLWRESIHATGGIVCHHCHGGDPKDAAMAMSPARGFIGVPKTEAIPDFCGRCHIGILQEYRASAHGRALGAGGPTCVTCHGNHRVQKATIELISEQRCSRCHEYARAERLRNAILDAERRIATIDQQLQRAKGRGVDTEQREKELFGVRNRLRSLFHTVDTPLVNQRVGQIQGDLAPLQQHLQQVDRMERLKRLVGAGAVAVALLTALLLHLLRRTYDRPDVE